MYIYCMKMCLEQMYKKNTQKKLERKKNMSSVDKQMFNENIAKGKQVYIYRYIIYVYTYIYILYINISKSKQICQKYRVEKICSDKLIDEYLKIFSEKM